MTIDTGGCSDTLTKKVMNRKRYVLAAVLGMAISCCFPSMAMAQSKGEEAYDITVELIHSNAMKRKTALFERYAQAVEKLQAEFQAAGELDNTLQARSEAQNARKSLAVGEKEFPGVAKLRKVLADELAKIEASERAQLEQAQGKYLVFLKKRVVELTKEGKLDDATRLSNELKTIEAQLAGGEHPAGPGDAPPSPLGIPQGELKQGEILFGELTLSGGNHRLREEFQIGRRKDNTDDEKGFLTIKDRAQLYGESIWTNFGTLVATDARFEKVLIREELHGTFTASRCLFEDCSFDKKGGWFVAWFGTKWHFDECVFQGSFFRRWANSNVGLKISNCTFIGVEFPSFQMKNDIVWESEHAWRTIEKCRFVDCEIPISVLLSIEDSVFEDCRFVEDDIAETKAALSASNASIARTVYFTGLRAPDIPSPHSKIRFQVKSAPSSMAKRGCPLFYDIKAGELVFR